MDTFLLQQRAATTTATSASWHSLKLHTFYKHQHQWSFRKPSSKALFSLRWTCKLGPDHHRISASINSSSSQAAAVSSLSSRPTPADAARTLIDVSNEGVLCVSSVPDGWPYGASVRFVVEPENGSPIFYLPPASLHSQYLQADSRCSLHIQMEQPGHRKPQCTFKGRVSRIEDDFLKQSFRVLWERRFREEPKEDGCFYLMNIDCVLHALDFGEENTLVSNDEYKDAVADPLRECAVKIVEDMNRNHWEDIRRFCNVFANLDLLVEEANLTWVDRLGFDMRILTASQEIVEIRIPFSREVSDERDARSSLTMMAQIAWEYDRNYNPPEIQMMKS